MFCQKCRTPLKLDTSLEDLNPTALKLLVEAASRTLNDSSAPSSSDRRLYTSDEKQRYDEAVAGTSSANITHDSLPVRDASGKHARALSAQDAGMSFIMLAEDQATPSSSASAQGQAQDSDRSTSGRRRRGSSHGSIEDGPLSHKMETTARLFEVLSSRSDIDHPICAECTEMITEGMEKRLANATKERDAYADFLRKASADLPTDEERHQLEIEIKAAKDREDAAFVELEQLEAEKAGLEQELADLEIESRALDKEEESFWAERNAFQRVLSDYHEQRDSLNLRYDHDSQQLERLQRTNVYNDTFNISHDKDNIATINGLRLGKRSNVDVQWAEINAAWGQALLLLTVVSEKLKFSFKGYRLHPMGSSSYIDKIEPTPPSQKDGKQNTTKLDLFYTSELPLPFSFMHRSFDAAMVAFVECLRQLGAHIEKLTATTEQPKKMNVVIKKDKINDKSIKLGSDEDWMSACKFTLAGCKWCLAYASNTDGPQSSSG